MAKVTIRIEEDKLFDIILKALLEQDVSTYHEMRDSIRDRANSTKEAIIAESDY